MFEDIEVADTDTTFILGRSMLTLAWQDFDQYTEAQQNICVNCLVIKLYQCILKIILQNILAVEFFAPKQIIDLCDTEVYLQGVGKHFEKTINFDIYKPCG